MSGFNYVSLFSGIGGFEQALNKLGGTCVLASEIDKFANQAYEVLYGHSTVGDITKVEAEEVPDHDVLVGGFPCFAAGTLITTRGGVKSIEDVRKGDEVLTHTNTFKPVVVPMVKRKKGIYTVKIQGSPRTQVTEEHPYYAREFLGRKWSNEKGKYERAWSEPKWVSTKDLAPGKHFVGFSENTLSENPHNITEEEAWLIGRYVADGYLRNNKRSGRENQYNNWVVYCIGKDKLNEFKTHISNYYVGYSEERTVYKARIINERFMKLCREAGRGSENKRVPGYILNLPKHLLEKFLDGYLSGDGSVSEGKYKATTVSKELVYGLGQIVQKLYNVPYSIVFTERPKTTLIEGRTVNQRDTWSIEFRKEARKQNQAVYIDGMLWNPVRSVEYDESFEGNVYNFEVAGDNSYVANNATVHNCQAFSVAGKRGGFEDARGTLFFEMARIAKEKQPKIFLAENVKGLLSHDKGRTMDTIVTTLSDIGYRVDFEVLNSKYFGVPQNRDRVFLIGIREDLLENESWNIPKGSTVVPKAKRRLAEYEDLKTFNFEWPEQGEVTTRLRDILESNVDEKYYLDEEKTARLVAQLEEKDLQDGAVGHHPFSKKFEFKGYNSEISPSLIATDYKAPKTVLESEPQMLGHVDIKGHDAIKRVYSAEGVSPTLTTMGGGHREPEIAEEQGLPIREATKKGYAVASEGDAVNIQFPNSKTRRGRVGKQIAQTLEASGVNQGVVEKEIRPVLTPDRLNKRQNGRRFKGDGEESFTLTAQDRHGIAEGVPPKYRIRKLTPLECWRLQGFPDEAHEAVKAAGISDSQRYKQAGNAVTVNVINAIGRKLIPYL